MRKVETVQVPAGHGRDVGKTFVITEMAAGQAEKWALRLFLAMKGTSAEVPPEVMSMGMIAVAWKGLNAFLAAPVKFEDVEPLMDEMFACVAVVRDPKHPEVVTPIASPDDVEEVKTRIWLRGEVLRVHTGFSSADALSKFLDAFAAPASQASPSM